jgi:hypothetical protein
LILVAAALFAVPVSAQTQEGGRARPPRIYNTQRLSGAPPSIDGRLDDEAWTEGEWAKDYIQQIPVEGGVPSQKTELKVLYDDKHVYYAIRAYDDMSKVTRYPARRDSISGDVVGVCFDSLFDKRSGFEFSINAAGTKIDLVLSNEGWDTTWDAVWDGKVAYEADAWTAEARIPLSQLRYSSQDVQVWGMHSWRWIDRLQEESQWNLIPRQGTGRMYNFGELHGISGLKPRRRLELMPYVLGEVESLPDDPGNPYVGDAEGKASAGLDAKIGLTSNFTLDATINPDFGQVEADPSVVNLTTYETFYEEKRPFFLEGKRLFAFGLQGSAIAGDQSGTLQGDQLFYSRRIGAPPSVHPAVDQSAHIEMPGETSILSAVKVTGKTHDGLSVGFLQSVTDDEQARVSANGIETRVPVAPTTNYMVGRVQKDWDKGNTMLGGLVTSTHRWLPSDAPAMKRLPSDAVTGAVDATHFFANRSYVVEGKGFFSRVSGDAIAIGALQTNAVHYFQRPDADHLDVDPDATSLSGHGGTLRVARYGNSKWTWGESVRWLSPGLDLNDVGYLQRADAVRNEARLEFSETEPRGPFRSYGLFVGRNDVWDFGGLKTDGSTGLAAFGSFRSLWGVEVELDVVDTRTDTRLLRGGPAMATSGLASLEGGFHSDRSKRVSFELGFERDFVFDGDGYQWAVSTEIDMRPTNAFSLSADISWDNNVENLQYVSTSFSGRDPKYVLGRLDQETLGVTFRANYFLTPDLSIQYYGSPFVSNGSYGRFKRASSTPRADAYGDRFHEYSGSEISYVPAFDVYHVIEGGANYAFANPDFEFRQFRSNLVGRWEFRPGSSLYVVWSQDRTDEEIFGKPLTDSLNQLRLAPAANVFLVKLSYWFGM